MQAKDLKPDSRFMGMFVSQSGDGKSCAAASFPKPIRYFDTDLRNGIIGAKEFTSLDGIEITRYAPFGGLDQYEKDLNVLMALFRSGQRPCETIVIDSATSLAKVALNQAKELGIDSKSGKKQEGGGNTTVERGITQRSGPAEFGFEQDALQLIMDFLRSMPCNIIVTGHLVDRYGKDPAAKDQYAETIKLGEKLSLRDRVATNLLIYFDEVYKFSRDETGTHYYVQFRGDIAKTVHKNLPAGRFDITNQDFYKFWQSKITA